jgi:hypothetical protein
MDSPIIKLRKRKKKEKKKLPSPPFHPYQSWAWLYSSMAGWENWFEHLNGQAGYQAVPLDGWLGQLSWNVYLHGY